MLTNGTLVMMDIEACKAASEQIIVGETTSGVLDGVAFDWMVLDKTIFSVKLQGPTNRLTVPIEYTNAYKGIISMRVPVPAADGAAPPKRAGRPPKATSAAPVDMPSPPVNPYLPPGYTGPSMGSMVQAGPGVGTFQVVAPSQPAAAQPTPTVPVQAVSVPSRVMTIEEASGQDDWPERSFDEAMATMQEHFMVILQGVRKEAVEMTNAAATVSNDAMPPRRLTCFDCVYFDNAAWMCSKFSQVPPLHVVATAVASCSEFIEAGGNLDDQIPF